VSERILVFDMDGVLTDVADSYRETICRTVEHFTGRAITRELVQTYKNQGGWNNDWALSRKIAADLGVDVDYDTVTAHFQRLFLGNGADGLILRERWLPEPGLLERLGASYRLAIFTGRGKPEAGLTLDRFAARRLFDPVVGSDDIVNGKPAPDGLLLIASRHPDSRLWYVGDTVDDARSARAAAVPFIGIASPSSHRVEELRALFRREEAIAILDQVNQIETVLES